MITQDFVLLLCFVLFSEELFAGGMSTSTKEAYNDASLVTWAHAVNSHQALETELEGLVNFLEADVSLGRVSENKVGPLIPIMAHPPQVVSDISLERWLDIVIARQSGKGIKLDFKSIDTVEPALQILQKHKGKLLFPLWLNADILPGPVRAQTTAVSAEKFLVLCKEYFPNATLSVGWTTYWHPSFPEKSWCYGWENFREMVDTLQSFGNIDSAALTFPVRAVFASRSISKLKWLLEVFPQATLTVWSGRFDILKTEDLLRIREAFPKSRVYYDVPGKIGNSFLERKDEFKMKPPAAPTFVDNNYVKMRKSQRNQSSTCSSNTYVTGRTIMFGKDCEILVFLKEMFSVTEETPLRAQGEITFFGNDSSSSSNKGSQLIIALAEAKSFSKDSSFHADSSRSEDDTDIPWIALNSSQLHVFRQEEGSFENTSCHFFQLDTTAKKPFQAWTVDCDQLKENRMEALNSGKSKVSSRKRLILPTGPLVFGMISSGEGYVVVDKFSIRGGASSSKSSAGSPTSYKVIFSCIVLTCFSLLSIHSFLQ